MYKTGVWWKTSSRHFITLTFYLRRLITLLLVAITLMGLYLYLGIDSVSEQTMASAHLLLAWIILFVIIAHVASEGFSSGYKVYLSVLLPGGGSLLSLSKLVGVVSLIALVFVVVISEEVSQTLTIHRTDKLPELDGIATDKVWKNASRVVVKTVRGKNLSEEASQVQISAVHDGENAYFLFVWQDESKSQQHLPLEKTIEGWRVKHDGFTSQDEVEYYEDKLAVMLSRDGSIAGGHSTHLGPKPLGNLPAALNARGYHYTNDGTIRDVWHWKSVRSGLAMGPVIGMFGDSYFGPPRPLRQGHVRYTAGYYQDPVESGGYTSNWLWYNDDFITPRRLPLKPDLLENRDDSYLEWYETRAYRLEDDQYPIGTLLPSVLSIDRIEGDRADVLAAATWKDGYWTLEASRALNTGSTFDLPIETGVYLWVSVFDHVQTRHSYHLHPVKIRVK
ncbi:MAG: ethylbenzene dehydrogenase-related protein [Sedimenticola sp.]